MTEALSALFIALLLQFAALPQRSAVDNPAAVSAVPSKLQKDYNGLWARFLKGKDDANLMKDADKFLKKNHDFAPVITVEAYLDLFNGRPEQGERRLTDILSLEPRNRIALSYLAEFAFGRQDYARASDLYARLIAADPSRTDVETKRQKALLLATEDLLRRASQAESANRTAEAEALYSQAIQIVPQEPSLHERLGKLLSDQKKWDEALTQFQKERELGGPEDETDRQIAECLANLGRTDEAREILDRLKKLGTGDARLEARLKELTDIGRWGKDIDVFRQIEAAPAITREQLSALFVRYFPQITDLRRTPPIVTDIQDSWARSEIQVVTGIGVLDPRSNHTFQPRSSVTRGELAVGLARLGRLLGAPPTAAPPFPMADVAPGNAIYRDVQMVVSYGLMSLDDAGSFNADNNVSGMDCVTAVERLLEKSRGS